MKEPWEKQLDKHDDAMPWRPMTSAPKDGSRVLISTTGNVAIAYWTEHANFGGHDDDRPGWQIFLCDGDEWYSVAVDDVSGWMPLPVALLRKRPR